MDTTETDHRARVDEFCASRGIDPDDRPKFSTERAAVALASVAMLGGGDNDAELVTDLLADLFHLADARGLDIDDLIEIARNNYEAEKRGEP